jgi:WD repeat-containing protein 48
MQSKLNAPRILQMHKVASYCQAKLLEQNVGVALRPLYLRHPRGASEGSAPPPDELLMPTVTDPATGAASPWAGPVHELELTCKVLLLLLQPFL